MSSRRDLREDLQSVIVIARAGSLSGAAAILGVDQATLSRRAARIELEHGLRLFDRSRTGVTLTTAGKSVLDVARRAEEQFQLAERVLRGGAPNTGLVRIAADAIISAELLRPHLPALLRRHSHLKLDFASSCDRCLSEHSQADIAITIRPPGEKSLDDRVVCAVGKVAWAAYKGSASNDAIVRVRRYRRAGAQWIESIAGDEHACWADDVSTAAALVLSGGGLAVLPCFYADHIDGMVRVSDVLEEHRLEVSIVPEGRDVARVRLVVEWLRRTLSLEVMRLSGRVQQQPCG